MITTSAAIFAVLVALALLFYFFPVGGKKRNSEYITEFQAEYPLTFPQGFLWGTATAAQQVEQMQESDWTQFVREAYHEKRFQATPDKDPKPGHILGIKNYDLATVQKSADFDEHFQEDLDYAKSWGHNAYRFSFCWSRLFPNEGDSKPSQKGLDYYHRMLDYMEEVGLMPSATLFHFSSPAWFWNEKDGKRGWEREDALEKFSEFTGAVADAFGPRINHWCTLNEPLVYIYNGYMNGIFPPLEQRKKIEKVYDVLSNLLKAHRDAYDILHQKAKEQGRVIQVGYTKHTRAFEPLRNYAFLDRFVAAQVEQAFVWDFMDAVKEGVLRVTNVRKEQEIPGLKGKTDYIGINYYGRFYIKSNLVMPSNFRLLPYDPHDHKEKINDLRWAQYPHGFSTILADAYRKYQKPIFILENGTADAEHDDRIRQEFLVTHLREMWYAMSAHNVDIRGYFHWSLMDNYEWAEGFAAKFGLLSVDYSHGQKRTPRKSADLLARIIQGGIEQEMMERYIR